LSAHLLAHTDWELVGTVYPQPVDEQEQKPRLRLHHLDLREPELVQGLVDEVRPDYVFHLAAQSIPAISFTDPWSTIETNVRAQLNVLRAVHLLELSARILVIGSNEEYGRPGENELPLTEDVPLRPASPYAVSKVTQDLMGLQFHLAYGLDVVRLRPFNHTGPGQGMRFVVPDFSSQVARIEAGLQAPVMQVGNLEPSRDFGDVRDVVRAYHLAATHGEAGEVYNVASGRAWSIGALLDMLLSYSDVDIKIEVDPARHRPVDVPVIYGSAAKLHRATGWQPEIPFEQTLRETLDYWRARARDGNADNTQGGTINA
jgi:GDP-4-dehydro-6-deoxy-D-mannose reductase